LSGGSLPYVQSLLLVAAFWSINVVAYIAERQHGRDRVLLDALQLLADTLIVLLFAWAQHDRPGAESADWAVLVLPAIEGAIRFRVPGAFATWLVVAGGYWGANLASDPSLPTATIAQRLTVVLLVALPVGYLADLLVAEITAHRHGRDQAEQRSVLLRTAALGGWRTSRLDVDEVLDVIRATVVEMGFTEPDVFELEPTEPAVADDEPAGNFRPVRGSFGTRPVPSADARRLAAAAARNSDGSTVWRPDADDEASTLFVLPIPMVEAQHVFLTAHWSGGGAIPAAPVESLELFAAQAGASLHNAQVHRGLEDLKDRLDHAASHDPLTELANRRLFTDELERIARRGRPSDLIGVLFLDLDGFKEVNDRYGHDAGNDLLVAVAERLRACVRPGDLVARIGGDEFTIMLTRLESVAPAAAVAERICSALVEPVTLGTRSVRITTSVGIALARAAGTDTADLMRRADAAMYRAKATGKARWMMDPDSLDLVDDSESHGRKIL
jgi:diguanylate cyclase (GGDEF)-like protein